MSAAAQAGRAIAASNSTVRFYDGHALVSLCAKAMLRKIGFCAMLGLLSTVAAACFYPPVGKPPPESQTHGVVNVPYDLTWDAVHTVLKDRDFKIQGDDPDHGIVEAEAHSFTLADADCGQQRSVGSKFDSIPEAGGAAVYNFKVEPAGPLATNVAINATYSTPLHVPFHPVQDFQCVSRGTQEARLLKEVDVAAHAQRRPLEITPSGPKRALTPGRPTLLRPGLTDPNLPH